VDKLIKAKGKAFKAEFEKFTQRLELLLIEVRKITDVTKDIDDVASEIAETVRIIISNRDIIEKSGIAKNLASCTTCGIIYFAVMWAVVHKLGLLFGDEKPCRRSVMLMDEMLLGSIVKDILSGNDVFAANSASAAELLKVLCLVSDDMPAKPSDIPSITLKLIEDDEARSLLGVNSYNKVEWFNKESYEALAVWLLYINTIKKIEANPEEKLSSADLSARILKLLEAGEESSYRLDWLLDLLSKSFGDGENEKD
jgi:hypothetical protein